MLPCIQYIEVHFSSRLVEKRGIQLCNLMSAKVLDQATKFFLPSSGIN